MAQRAASCNVDLFADMVVGTHDHPVLRTIHGLADLPARRALVGPSCDASGIGRPST